MPGREDVDLSQRAVEGALSAGETDRLTRLLARDPEARVTLATLRALTGGPDTALNVEPDDTAVAEIMRRVQQLPLPQRRTARAIVRRCMASAALAWSRVQGQT